MDYEPARVTAKPRRPIWTLLAPPLVAFLAGLAAMGWLLANWGTAATFLGIVPAPPPAAEPAPQPVMLEHEAAVQPPADAPAGERLVIDPETTRRVNRLEERLALLDLQSRTAVGNADRAEGLLVAFAARRAIDRGVALGYIETLLRERFAASEPEAVATVLTVARQPVTAQSLQKEFQEIAPHLSGGGQGQSWWGAFKTELAGLVTIRRENTPSTQPAERLRRAGQSLESGQVEVALLEVLRLPGHERADKWIANARRYVASHRALDRLESAALLEPRAPAVQPQPAAKPR
ncbi:MAG TPA: hypothetical protein VFQ67_02780 [Allosphingosinicella sp.]|jgi:hypothetical protein|nr:hypothetical protein [Allosphingosinicella sp.]